MSHAPAMADSSMQAVAWLFRRGLKPAHLAARSLFSLLVDSGLGVRTTDEVIAKTLTTDIEDYRRTMRSLGWFSLYRIMKSIRPKRDDVFLDIGCGVGRATCVAAFFGFARVIGIDNNPTMASIASTNVAAFRHARCPVEIVLADATSYEVPEDVTVVFFYNPFSGSVMAARVLESYERRPRRIRVVYANPKDHDYLVSLGRFKQTRRLALGWRPNKEWTRTQAVHFYEVLPAGGSVAALHT